jgi:hypothetical protein
MEQVIVKRKVRRYSDAEKQSIVAAFATRTGTQLEFCRQHRVSLPTLKRWMALSSGRGVGAAGFIELPPPQEGWREGVIAAALAGGVTLWIPAQTDPSWLGNLIRGLRCGA